MKAGVSTTIGLLVAPLVTSLLIVAPIAAKNDAGLALLLLVYLTASAYMLVLGVPAYLIVRRFYKVDWLTTVLIGSSIVIIALVTNYSPNKVEPSQLVFFAVLGAGSSLAFWLIWKKGH